MRSALLISAIVCFGFSITHAAERPNIHFSTPGYRELYDLKEDPHEMNNFYVTDVCDSLKATLTQQLQELRT